MDERTVIDTKPTEKKTTSLLKCRDGEIVAVTAFAKEKEEFCKGCSVGTVVEFNGLKAQAFDKSRFDGKAIFGTPLEFELIFHQYSALTIMKSLPSKKINGFDEVKPGPDSYVVTCLLKNSLRKAGPNVYGCEVVDLKGYRADLLIKAKELNSDLLGAKKGNKMILDKIVVTISGDCMTLNLDSSSKLKLVDDNVYKMAEVLKTPVKRKGCDGIDEQTPKKK